MLKSTLKAAFVLAAFSGLLCLSAPSLHAGDAHDHDEGYVEVDENTDTGNPNIKHFKYEFNSSVELYPEFNLVWEAMQPTFKGTYADKNNKNPMNPTLMMTEFDLNNDKNPEIIALPIEGTEYGDVFCGPSMLCPHYVIDLSGKTPKTIGLLRAFAVDRGDDIVNGYWTLKAFTKQNDPKNFSYYDLYAYDGARKEYTKLDKEPAPPTLKK